METLYKIDPRRKTPKYLQIAHGINQAIMSGKLKRGDQVHSINEASDDFSLGRETVQKAYNFLRKQGVLVSVPGKGFFVNRTDLHAPYRILLLFNKLSNYKTEIYNGFVNRIGQKALYDLKIHQADLRLFERQLREKYEEYDHYVVIPHFNAPAEQVLAVLAGIPEEKLVLLDKDLPALTAHCAGAYQDFRKDIYQALELACPQLTKYREIIVVQSPLAPCHLEMAAGARDFCRNHDFICRIVGQLGEEWVPASGQAYIITEDIDLSRIIRGCQSRELTIGEHVGIISYNDSPLKEVLLGGITVVTTDHASMGETAAQLILENTPERRRNPFRLIHRNTL